MLHAHAQPVRGAGAGRDRGAGAGGVLFSTGSGRPQNKVNLTWGVADVMLRDGMSIG